MTNSHSCRFSPEFITVVQHVDVSLIPFRDRRLHESGRFATGQLFQALDFHNDRCVITGFFEFARCDINRATFGAIVERG